MPPTASLSLRRADIWRADELAPTTNVVASGHAVLDTALPGGGWPAGALIDLALESANTPWSALLLPALTRQVARTQGLIAWIAPPREPGLPALAAGGMPPASTLWLSARSSAERLWLAEQAVGCAGVTLVLAWLPRTRTADLRRLHWAAARRGDVLFFAFRASAESATGAACAPLSLALRLARNPAAARPAPAVPQLRLDILRRRGPPMLAPLWLPAWNPLLEAVLREATRVPGTDARPAAVVPLIQPLSKASKGADRRRAGHALDRLAVAV